MKSPPQLPTTRVDGVPVYFGPGMRFGRLVLRQRVRENPKLPSHLRKKWLCDCDCGKREVVTQYYLVRKPNPRVNCGGCLDLRSPKVIYYDIYGIWYMMQRRCYDPRHVGYKYYGGRGIIVCEEWLDEVIGFETFLRDMGARPTPRHSIDRFPDPDGNYEPKNVRWATPTEQANNKSKSKLKTEREQ